jgi:Nitroreductase family
MRDPIGRLLRAEGWLDFEIAVHRVTRSATATPLDAPGADGRQVAGRRPVRWPTEPLPVLQERRRSQRDLGAGPLFVEDLLDVVVPSFLTPDGRPAFARPGATSAISTTALVCNVDGLAQGVYAVSPAAGTLTCLRRAPFEQVSACVDLSDVTGPAAVLMLCVHLARRRQYANAYELALLEAGQLLQNLALAAAGAGIDTCVLGSVFDEPFWSVVAEPHDSPAQTLRHGAPLVAMALGYAGRNSTLEGFS